MNSVSSFEKFKISKLQSAPFDFLIFFFNFQFIVVLSIIGMASAGNLYAAGPAVATYAVSICLNSFKLEGNWQEQTGVQKIT